MQTNIIFARTLVEAIKSGSITSAAKTLNISRAAASKHIKQLEDKLSVQLLNRNTRNLSLTEPGELYYRTMSDVLKIVIDLEDKVSNFQNEVTGILRINSTIALSKVVLKSAIDEFLATHPKAAIEYTSSDEISDLISTKVDIAFRTGTPVLQGMIAKKVCDITFKTVASPKYMESKKTLLSFDELKTMNCLNFRFPSTNQIFQWSFKEENQIKKRTFKGNLFSSNIIELYELAKIGTGVAHLPNQLVDEDISNGNLIDLFPQNNYVSNKLCMYFSETRRNSKIILEFKRIFFKYLPMLNNS